MMALGEPVGDCEASHAPMAKHACSIPAAHGTSLPASTLALLTVSAATVAAGSYFTQPAASMIGHDLHLSPLFAGLLVTASQIGYVLGLLFLMPLGDLVENRILLSAVLACSVASLLVAATAQNGIVFVAACIGVGMSSIAVQILVMQAAFMTVPEHRGRVAGTVTSGLLAGILVAWPMASFVSVHFGWRRLFGCDALVVTALALALAYRLPHRSSGGDARYPELIGSLWGHWTGKPELRHRSIRQAFLFFCFSLFWTAIPVELRVHLGLGHDQIALFGLVGGTGALIAPVAGRIADLGKGNLASLFGVIAVAGGFLVTSLLQSVWSLCLAAIAIGAGVQANHVVSQRAVLSLQADATSRLNALYIAVFFLGGAMGSAISTLLLRGGWTALGLVGGSAGIAALALMPNRPPALNQTAD